MHPLRSVFLALATAAALQAAEPDVDPAQLPRIPPTDPALAPATFKVKPGFRVELAVAEPDVVSPVAMSFDEDGRLYVIEMRDYSERRPERLGRVRLLEDTDGDGRFEKSTVFAQDLAWPTAVTCWAGGVFVGATPDLLYLKDTDGDGVADVREVIFAGFASDYAPFATNQLNVQALMNSFQWTLDNRIHGATSFSGGKVRLVDTPFVREWLQRAGVRPYIVFRDPKLLDLRGRDFSFDPRTLDLRGESGGGQHGMSFDDRGRKFVCSNSDHIQQVLYEDRYAARNPGYAMPSPRVSIAADGPAAEVYRLSPEEPWRVIRTAWRMSGQVKGPIEGGGRASGYFTGATGLTLYRGDAYGEDFAGDAFIGDAGGNLVHRKKLRPDGLLLRAERPADEQKVEFLASTDTWFRPVQFANGPDGCLHIADMYREVIEHPWSLPPNLKKHLDLNSGSDRGRIWRIVPEQFRRPPAPRLGRLSAKALTGLLQHRNGWMRDTAARLIYERQDARAVPGITALTSDAADPAGTPLAWLEARNGVLHGLSALAGLRALPEEELIRWLGTNAGATPLPDEARNAVTIHVLKLAEPFLRNPSEALLGALRAQAGLARGKTAPTPVELQLVFTLGQVRGQQKVELLRHFIESQFLVFKYPQRLQQGLEPTRRDLQWISPALVNGLGDDAMALVESMNPLVVLPDARHEILAAIARPVGARNRSNEVTRIIQGARPASATGRASILGSLQDGLQQAGTSLARYEGAAGLDAIFREAATNATAGGLGLNLQAHQRLASIRLLGLVPDPGLRSNLLWLVTQPAALAEYRAAALASLGRSGDEPFAAELLAVWPQLTPALRADALGRFVQRVAWIDELLQAIEAGALPASELSVAQAAQLRSHRNTDIREQAAKVLGRVATDTRASVVAAFGPALALPGDATAGRNLFVARCATCHKLGGDGHALGPDLATVRNGGKEKLLIGILDPNREVAPNFASYSVETKDGESHTGVIASETGASVTLRQAGGLETTFLRANIVTLQGQGRSLMPEGLEEGLTAPDLADLMEFIMAPAPAAPRPGPPKP